MQKRFNVLITKSAQNDIENIYDFIAQDSVKSAAAFIGEIEKKITGLKYLPERNPLIPENEYFNTLYRHLIYKDYRIIYRIEENNVYILRFYHAKRMLKENK